MKKNLLAMLIYTVLSAVSFGLHAQKKLPPGEEIKPGDLPRKTITRNDRSSGSITVYGPYAPDVNSISRHQCPEWFRDAKFGMFIDWGLYSIAGWAPKKENGAMYPDWYMNNMLLDDETKAYHAKTWGENFMPDDFIPLFEAENYQPEKLIQTAADAGMKYVIPFCKHHDGYCLWPSSYTGRDAMDMAPRRDLIRPLTEECNRLGLKFGFYFSVEEYNTPVVVDGEKKIRTWNGAERYLPWNTKEIKKLMSGKYFVDGDFFSDYIVPQAREFIDMYDPDILWFDGEWSMTPEELHTPDIASYFYNRAQGRKEVALNDRNGQVRHKIGDFFCSEYHSIPQEMKLMHPWEENRGISQSFGYNWQDTEENVLTVDEFIDLFTRTVSENGNLLLIVNLDGKGALPEVQERRLLEIGKWLKINGEAIYGSRPCPVTSQDGGKIRFTQSKDGSVAYAICTDFPKDELTLNSFYVGAKTEVSMLGAENIALKWKQVKTGWAERSLVVDIPDTLYANRKNDYAWVFKISKK
jgi:alpha-L-fucosidase